MPQTYYTATPDPSARFQCRHIFPDGHRCASPCLRNEELCYYHNTTRRPIANPAASLARAATFTLPNPADLVDRSGIQLAIAEVLHRIAANDIDPRRAGLLLYGLQIASLNLPKQPTTPPPVHLVDETTEDPNLGTLAPRARIQDLVPKSEFQRIMERYNAEDNASDNTNDQADEPQPILLPDIQATAAHPSSPSLIPEALEMSCFEARKERSASHAEDSITAISTSTPEVHSLANAAPTKPTPNPNPLRTLAKRGEGRAQVPAYRAPALPTPYSLLTTPCPTKGLHPNGALPAPPHYGSVNSQPHQRCLYRCNTA